MRSTSTWNGGSRNDERKGCGVDLVLESQMSARSEDAEAGQAEKSWGHCVMLASARQHCA
eukprot:1158945-Pelagomonas_calceolata.AAC.2